MTSIGIGIGLLGLGSCGGGGRLLVFWAIFLMTAYPLLLLMSVSVDGLCIPRERDALLSFKRGLTDPSHRLSSWRWVEDEHPHGHGHDHGVDCCHWLGVVCHNSTGHVLKLRLGCEGSMCREMKAALGGKLSPSLLDLKHLTHLDLSLNDFQGIPIPRFLGSLHSLTYLNFCDGGFGGMIPQQLGNLSNLHLLDLGSFYYSPTLRSDSLGWVTGLSKLQNLDLSRVDMSRATDWLQATNTLPSLKQLRLSSCQIISAITIPPTTLLGHNFSHLSVLDLSGNSFSRVPEWVFSLPSLTSLFLSGNNFPGPIPVGLANLTRLTTLHLSGNSFNSSFPECLFHLNKLATLDLSSNRLYGPIPVGLANLTRLTTLHLSDNSLNSSIPECLFHLNKLASLDLSSNSLSGPIPVGLANLTRLTTLHLSDNSFNSSIPQCLFHLNKLATLHLGWNSLEGVIPEGIGNMTALSSLDLSYNSKLQGVGHVLFKSLGNLCSLRVLALSGIKLGQEGFQAFMSLSGCLLPGLFELELRETQLTGKFGNLVDKLSAQSNNLARLYLPSNSLHGPFPESIGGLSSLEYLSISNNQLNGTLPESLGHLTRLRGLYIYDNQLMGIVTQAHFSNLTKLQNFYASRNKLSLKVGPKWIPPFQLWYLDLDSWQIGPRFPQWLRSQKHLRLLQLSGVGISSTIPGWFQKSSPNCQYYNLSHNQIQGGISNFVQSNFRVDTVIHLGSSGLSGPLPPISSRVVRLYLSNNQFSGSISHFLCHKPSEQNCLELLDLAKNNMSGEISDCLMNWRSLIYINFEYNEFIGHIPSSIQSLSHLRSLYLRNNHFQGELPISLKDCTSLVVMDLAENDFLGSIPSWMGERFIAMAFLSLRSNRFFGQIPHQLCALTSLQVLDLAHNNLSGSIPTCFNNLTAMAIVQNLSKIFIPLKDTLSISMTGDTWGRLDHAYIAMKDRTDEYSTNLGLVTSLDLSNNFLSGEIPKKLTSLINLRSLNLSNNHLTGRIPETIGMMKAIESIDFSTNQLFGVIPTAISGLTFINHFNVCNNKLVGKIPLSTQLQSLNASSFSGNQLCGPPLNDICSGALVGDEIKQGNKGTGEKVEWFYVSMIIGFVVGFWFVWAPLLFKKSWRLAYFKSLYNLWQRIIVLFKNHY